MCVWGGGGGGWHPGVYPGAVHSRHTQSHASEPDTNSQQEHSSVRYERGRGSGRGMQTVETGRNAAVTCQYPRACGPLALKEWVCAEGPKGSTAVAAQRARAAPLAHAQSGRSEQRSACLSAGLRRRGTGNSKCATGRGFVAISVDPLDTGSSLHCSGTTPSHNPLRHLPRHWTLRSAGPLADAESVRIAAPQGCHRSQLSTVASSVLEHWTFSYSSTRLRKPRQPLQPSQ